VKNLPDGIVLDGEILAIDIKRATDLQASDLQASDLQASDLQASDFDGPSHSIQRFQPLPFAQLQRRINRKSIGKKLMAEVPVAFIAFDLLEYRGEDFRSQSLHTRRHALEKLISALPSTDGLPRRIYVSTTVPASSWEQLHELRRKSKDYYSEGLMLKGLQTHYTGGRVRGVWWKWKVEPETIDAVLIYAQRGHGRRASLYSDYTFAVWDQGVLVPFAKAYSGLSDEEMKQVDRYVRENTKEKFGPVRSVTPKLVMEIAFENIQASTRHKSGLAVRFPRISRWRQDKGPADANTLDDLKRMIRTP
jgi:DNA ligase 1